MLQALQKIPHGWLPGKVAMGLLVSRVVLMLCLVPIGLLALPSHEAMGQRLITIIMALYFSTRIIVLLGVAERVDLGLLSSISFDLGILTAFLINLYLGLAIVVASILLSLTIWIASKLRNRGKRPPLEAA